MIVPLKLEVEQLHGPTHEEFFVDVPLGCVPVPEPRYRVVASAVDTERMRVVSYEFHSTVDRRRDGRENVGAIVQTPVSLYGDQLRALRAAIDGLLGEVPTKLQTLTEMLRLARSLSERGADVASLLVMLAADLAGAEEALPDVEERQATIVDLLGPEE